MVYYSQYTHKLWIRTTNRRNLLENRYLNFFYMGSFCFVMFKFLFFFRCHSATKKYLLFIFFRALIFFLHLAVIGSFYFFFSVTSRPMVCPVPLTSLYITFSKITGRQKLVPSRPARPVICPVPLTSLLEDNITKSLRAPKFN